MTTITYLHPEQSKLRIAKTIKPEPLPFNEWVKYIRNQVTTTKNK
jgi:hypothetical protein